MPYKINARGSMLFLPSETPSRKRELTEMQNQALEYLYNHRNEDRYIHAHEVATYFGYPNGQWMRGPLASLHKRGFITKDPHEM